MNLQKYSRFMFAILMGCFLSIPLACSKKSSPSSPAPADTATFTFTPVPDYTTVTTPTSTVASSTTPSATYTASPISTVTPSVTPTVTATFTTTSALTSTYTASLTTTFTFTSSSTNTQTPSATSTSTCYSISGTNLGAGDVAFLGIDTKVDPSGQDSFAFVLLAPVSAGTTIYFTDEGWDASSSSATFAVNSGNDGIIAWSTSSSLPAGTVVQLNSTSGTQFSVGTYTSVFGQTPLGLSNGADQLFAFQSCSVNSSTGAVNSPIFLAGFNFGTWVTSGTITSSTSYLPSQLTQGDTASSTGAVKAYYYNGTGALTNSASNIRAVLYNSANWTTGSYWPGTYPSYSWPVITIGASPTPTFTWTPGGPTETFTLTPTATFTITSTFTFTATNSITNTPTVTFTPTVTLTQTETHTPGGVLTSTPTPVPTAAYITQWSVNSPAALAINGTTLYVPNLSSVLVFNTSDLSNPITTWSSFGDVSFGVAVGVAVNPLNGNVYIADGVNYAIYQFTSAGVTVNASSYTDFCPWSVSTDSKGNIYVPDSCSNLVKEFSPTNQGDPINTWSVAGSNTLNYPEAIAFDSADNLYIADAKHVYELAAGSNTLLNTWNYYGGGDKTSSIYQITIDTNGAVYVADAQTNLVEEYIPGEPDCVSAWDGSQGGGTAFSYVVGVAAIPGGKLLVSDLNNGIIGEYQP